MRLLLLLFILSYNCLFSQSDFGKATYSLIPILNQGVINSQKREGKDGITSRAIESAKKIKPILRFTANRSIYYVEGVKEDIDILLGATLFNGFPNKVLVSINDRKVQFNNLENMFFKENKYIITDSLLTNWDLSNETKYINNYLCYKATIVHSIESKKGVVTAWYCPEIPYSFGPKGYGGLPGLIIELHDKFSIIGLEKIEFNIPFDENEFELKGEIISAEKYHQMFKEMIEND